MMPGENHFKALAIAVDATTGNCQNCSVLQQSLGEYVSSLLALKREITVSDDTIRLQQELEELQLQLVTLERKMVDYESLQAELQEKKSALKVYGQLYEEMEKLKEGNSRTVAENKKLEDQIKNVKDLSEKQSLENAQLRREKAVVEDDLLKSQASLQKSQAQAEQVEKLAEDNAKLTSTNNSLKRKVQTLEDSVCQQMHQISQLTKEKSLLERNIHDLQVRLMKLERQNNKEYRSTTTQASAPAEAKIDKEKFRRLLESLWACVEPEQSVNQLHFPESSVPPSSPQTTRCTHPSKMSPFDSQNTSESPSLCKPAKTAYAQLKLSPRAQGAIKHKASNKCLSERKQTGSKRSPKEHKTHESSKSSTGMDMLTLQEIMTLFKPMPPSISPIPDLDTEMESVKMDDGDSETHHKPSDDARTLKEEQPIDIATSSSSQKNPKSSALQTEENADLTVVTIQGEISNEKDSATKPGSFNGEINGKIITDIREMYPQTNRLIEQEPSSAQLSPSPSSFFPSSSFTGLMEAVSLPTKCPPLSFSLSSTGVSGISETQNALGNTKGDHLETVACKEDEAETVTSMDVDRTVTPEGSESPRASDCVEGTVVVTAENGSEIEKNTQDSFKPHESTESLCKDSDISESISVCNENLEEKREVDESIKVLATEDGTALPALSNCDNIPLPLKSPLLKKEDGLSSNVQECGEANVETSSRKDGVNCECLTSNSLYTRASPSCPGKLNPSVNKDLISTEKGTVYPNLQEEGNIDKATVEDLAQQKIHTGSNMPLEAVPAVPETNAANCKSSKENKQLGPSCLSSTIKLQSLETQPSPEISDADVHTENISTNIQTPFMLEEQGVTRTAILEDLPESKVDGGGITPLIQSPAATERQDKCLKLHTKVPENLIREEKTASGESSAVAQECISDVRSKMGPPLPRLLTPLKTPPKANSSINPRQAIGKLLFPSPMDGVDSPTSPIRASRTPNNHQQSSLSTNSPNGVPSSPLQFGSATPKHAVPVPGRLPLTAMSSPSSTAPSQENSMRILDTMYPELSARARTLSILRGNVNLSICSSESRTLPTTDSQKSSFKTINSTATAFTKTEMRGEKRSAVSMPQPRNKCLRLESSSAGKQVPSSSSNSGDDSRSAHTPRLEQHKTPKTTSSPMISVEHPEQNLILKCLRKIESQCFDLLPVIQSRVYVGNMPKKPVLRDEEKEVISEVCQSSSADDVVLAILNTLKAGKMELSRNYMQALCRVYTAICRQRREVEKVRVLAYSLLVEDFPDSAKLVLFVITTWPTVLTHTSSLCQAIHAVTKLKTPENLLNCFSAFLGWDKSPPCDIDELISRTLSEVRSGSDLSFIKHSRYGEDLGTRAWEHVYALHLLCTNKNWKWTYDNLLGKELWPLMNSWIAQPRQQQEPISDVAAATVLRLIGRIGQMGMKKKCVSTVVTIAKVINSFGRHGPAEGVPWEVQLAAVYCIYDLSPCNPKQALEALAGWRGETSQSVPPAVTSCINQLASVCRQVNS